MPGCCGCGPLGVGVVILEVVLVLVLERVVGVPGTAMQ